MIITGVLVMITSSLLLTPADASTPPEPQAQPQAQTQTQPAAPLAGPRIALRAGDYCGPGANNWRSWMVPDHFHQADWSAICDRHDRCYSSNSLQDRRYCDSGMNRAMVRECSGAIADPNTRVRCINRARTYYNAVRRYAKSRYHGHGSNA